MTTIFSQFFSHTTIFILIAYALMRLFKFNHKIFIGLLCGLIALSFMPIQGVSIAAYVRGYLSDLSITTVIYAWVLLFYAFKRDVVIPRRQLNGLFVWVLLCALLVYPTLLTTLGSWMPYYWGYAPFSLSFVFLGVAIVAYLCRYWLLAFSILITVCVYYLHGLPSSNLWNYALDPVVVVIAIFQCVFRYGSRIKCGMTA